MRGNNVLLGIGIIVLTVCVFPFAKPAISAVATSILALTPGSGAFEQFIVNSSPFWVLGGVITIGILMMVSGTRSGYNG